MRGARWHGLATGLAVGLTALPAFANRLTFEVRPDLQPDHIIACSVALQDGWISLVQVRGVGMPARHPIRWRMSQREEAAILTALQAFIAGDTASIDPYASRTPAPPFVSVTWMTSLDGDVASGLYLQPGLHLPGFLKTSLTTLGLENTCGLSAKAAE